MELDKWQENTNIVIDNINVERVQSFQYLGAMFTTNGDGASNIKQRLAMAVQALNNIQYMWKSASKQLKPKACEHVHVYSQLLHMGVKHGYYAN